MARGSVTGRTGVAGRRVLAADRPLMPRGLLDLVDPSIRNDVLRIVQAELADRYEDGVGIRLRAAAWVVTAQA